MEDRIETALQSLAQWQKRVSTPGATIEDELSYQQARVRLALAERDQARAETSALRKALREAKRPKHLSPRDRAEENWSIVSKQEVAKVV